jgi:hypothetical protein
MSATNTTSNHSKLVAAVQSLATNDPPNDTRPDRPPMDQPDEWNGLDVRRFSGNIQEFGPRKTWLRSYETAWVVDDVRAVADYVAQHGDQFWPVPESYASLDPKRQRRNDTDSYPRYCSRAIGTLYQYGYGIDAARIETAHRVLTGGGRFDPDDYVVIACGNEPFLVGGPEGIILMRPGMISRPETPDQQASTHINANGKRFAVEEDNQDVLTGLEQLVTAVDKHFPISVERYVRVQGGQYSRHAFELGSGIQYSAEATMLATLGKTLTSPSDVPVFEGGTVPGPSTWSDTSHEMCWSGPNNDDRNQGPVGDRTSTGGAIVGYQFEWERLRGRTYQGTVKTYSLKLAQSDASVNEFRLHDRTTRLSRVEF